MSDFFAAIPADTVPTAEGLTAIEAASRDRVAAHTQEQKEEVTDQLAPSH